MSFRRICWLFMIALSTIGVASAQATNCSVLIDSVLTTVGDACADLSRNQVCYGNNALSAQDFDNNPVTELSETGDITPIFNIASIATEPLNIDTEEWGIALLALQADLPDTVPGQNVIFVVFGDTEMINHVPPEPPLTLTATSTGAINVRQGAGTGFGLAGTLALDESVTLIGRNEAMDWVQIELGDRAGWVYVPLLTIEDDISDLQVAIGTERIDPDASAMQAFTLRSGIGSVDCEEAPRDGILVQAPTNTVVHFQINGINVEVGSTAYIYAEGDTLVIHTLDGVVRVTSGGVIVTIEPGFYTVVRTNSVPADPTPYNYDDVRYVPVRLLHERVGVPIRVGGNSDWVDTGIPVAEGDVFRLKSRGTVNFWADCEAERAFTPGLENVDCSSLILSPEGGLATLLDGQELPASPDDMLDFPAPTAQLHSLAGRIGDTTFFVGEGGTFIAEDSGTLEFRVNDTDQNNSGAFYVVGWVFDS